MSLPAKEINREYILLKLRQMHIDTYKSNVAKIESTY